MPCPYVIIFKMTKRKKKQFIHRKITPAVAAQQQPERIPLWHHFILPIILIICFVAFYPVLNNGFLNWDDPQYILDNLLIRSLDWQNIHQIFTSSILKVYTPLTVFSFAIEYHFVQFKPFLYHLNNILLHLGVTGLAFYLFRKLNISLVAASIGTLLFAIHPMHVESVAWVTERKDVLYSFFYLLSIISYLKYIDTKKITPYLFTIIFGLLSMLSKPMALSLPLIFFLFDWIKKRPLNKTILIDKIPHFAYCAGIAWITFSAHSGEGGGSHYTLKSIFVAIWTFMFYLKKFFLPIDLSPFYQIKTHTAAFQGQLILSSLMFISLLIILWFQRRNKWLIFAFLYYTFSIFFLMRFDTTNDFHIVADRFIYLPCLGICLAFGIFAEHLIKKYPSQKIITSIGLLGIFLFLFISTFQQTKVWNNNSNFWNHIILKDENNALAYTSRADAYFLAGKFDLAKNDLDRAIELDPKDHKPYFTRGAIYAMNGKRELALNDLNQGLSMNTTTPEAYLNRANLYTEEGKSQLAIEDFNKAIELSPTMGGAYFGRGTLYSRMGEQLKAEEDFDKALQFYNPRFSSDYFYCYLIYAKRHQWKEALSFAIKAKQSGYQISENTLESLRQKISNSVK